MERNKLKYVFPGVTGMLGVDQIEKSFGGPTYSAAPERPVDEPQLPDIEHPGTGVFSLGEFTFGVSVVLGSLVLAYLFYLKDRDKA